MPQKNNPALLMFVFFDFGTSPENDEVLLYWRNCKKEQQQHQKAHLRNVKWLQGLSIEARNFESNAIRNFLKKKTANCCHEKSGQRYTWICLIDLDYNVRKESTPKFTFWCEGCKSCCVSLLILLRLLVVSNVIQIKKSYNLDFFS